MAVYAGTAPVAAIYAGTAPVTAIYAGTVKIWPVVLSGSWPATTISASAFGGTTVATIAIPASPAAATWAVDITFAWPASPSGTGTSFFERSMTATLSAGATVSAYQPPPTTAAWADTMSLTITPPIGEAGTIVVAAIAPGWPADARVCSGSWTAQKV